jgi:hypothetical protein
MILLFICCYVTILKNICFLSTAIDFKYYPPFYTQVVQVVFSFQDLRPKFCFLIGLMRAACSAHYRDNSWWRVQILMLLVRQVRFQVLTAASMKMAVFWVVASCMIIFWWRDMNMHLIFSASLLDQPLYLRLVELQYPIQCQLLPIFLAHLNGEV